MNNLFKVCLLVCCVFFFASFALASTTKIKNKVVQVSCGQCQFGMKKKGCDLAVKIKGKTYFVEGTGIDEHGDAHASDGFCLCVRKARVTGEIVGDKFKAKSFKLLPL